MTAARAYILVVKGRIYSLTNLTVFFEVFFGTYKTIFFIDSDLFFYQKVIID